MSRLESIVSGIRELVVSQGLAPGDRLPPERVLAERFGVSRNSVRESLRILIEAGALESRRGSGTYLLVGADALTLQDTTKLQHKLEQQLSRKHRRLKDIFAFRRIIEPGMAALAAANATPRDVERLKAIVYDQQRALAGSGAQGEQHSGNELDTAFHLELARVSRNEVLLEVFSALENVFTESREREAQSSARRAYSPDGHFSIIQAIEEKDPERCHQAMEDHIHEAERLALEAETTKNSKGKGKAPHHKL